MDPQTVSATALALTLSLQAALATEQRTAQATPLSRTRVYSAEHARRLAQKFGRPSWSPNSTSKSSDAWILDHLGTVNREVDRYEDQSLRDKALDIIPFDLLNERATAMCDACDQENSPLAYQDALVQALVEWAKQDGLKWVDPITCSQCGGKTEGISGGVPSSDECKYGASRVEVYRCLETPKTVCRQNIERFPRYTNLVKLLETRTGRCGEFAAIFMLFLRALNLRARYIWNSEDHVWNEYYSEALQRWVHVDSCEGARDKNLLYDKGWGKPMRYCIAFGQDGAKDVTKTYITNWAETCSRRDPGIQVAIFKCLQDITEERRKHSTAAQRQSLSEEDSLEEAWLNDAAQREQIAARSALSGRTSGTKEWRKQRHETGQDPSRLAVPQSTDVLPNLTMSAVTINGSASRSLSQDHLILTRDKPGETGSAFLNLPSDIQDWVVEFAFRIDRSNSAGADGMAFVIHSDPRGAKALGRGGCDLGYGGLENCIALEIDTYRSQDTCDDPPVPHISVHQTGLGEGASAHHRHSVWCSGPGSLPDLDDGRVFHLRIEVSRTRQAIRVYFTDDLGLPFAEITPGPVKVGPLPSSGHFVGWTAATGGLHQAHEITMFRFWRASNIARNDTL